MKIPLDVLNPGTESNLAFYEWIECMKAAIKARRDLDAALDAMDKARLRLCPTDGGEPS